MTPDDDEMPTGQAFLDKYTDPDLISRDYPPRRSWGEWWDGLPGSVRTGLVAGFGVPLWLLWLIGGLAISDGLWHLWWPLGIAWLAVDVGVAVGVPVWLATRGLD